MLHVYKASLILRRLNSLLKVELFSNEISLSVNASLKEELKGRNVPSSKVLQHVNELSSNRIQDLLTRTQKLFQVSQISL